MPWFLHTTLEYLPLLCGTFCGFGHERKGLLLPTHLVTRASFSTILSPEESTVT